jgi:tol-pal system protein YbgF
MRVFQKRLLAGGLVIATSPFCFMAAAQDYVDVEAERAAREAAGREASRSADPYTVRPAQAYPATTYGAPATSYSVDGNAAGPATAAPAPATGGTGGPNLGNLFFQLQQLQQEVMRLNGKVEEQAFEIRRLQEQNRERYLDIDRRLSELATGSPGRSSSAAAEPPVVLPPKGEGRASGDEKPGEAAVYQAAYDLVIGRRFGEAIPAFEVFLDEFPDGKFAPNANYWLGELFLVKEPPDLESSRQAFALLLSEYPLHTKAADALYKLGTVQFMKGNREKAREYLDLVLEQYGSSNPAVAKLARDFIAENY